MQQPATGLKFSRNQICQKYLHQKKQNENNHLQGVENIERADAHISKKKIC